MCDIPQVLLCAIELLLPSLKMQILNRAGFDLSYVLIKHLQQKKGCG